MMGGGTIKSDKQCYCNMLINHKMIKNHIQRLWNTQKVLKLNFIVPFGYNYVNLQSEKKIANWPTLWRTFTCCIIVVEAVSTWHTELDFISSLPWTVRFCAASLITSISAILATITALEKENLWRGLLRNFRVFVTKFTVARKKETSCKGWLSFYRFTYYFQWKERRKRIYEVGY